MQIHYFKPFNLNKNIGKAYNEAMSLLSEGNDWGCLLDGDTMFLTSNYGKQISDIIENYKENKNIGILTCLTNRIGNPYQRYNGIINEDPNIKNHIKIALKLQKEKYLDLLEIPRTISGHMMLIPKWVWEEAGGFDEEGILQIDNKFSKKILLMGKKIYLMQGIYIFHNYRLLQGKKDKTHLK